MQRRKKKKKRPACSRDAQFTCAWVTCNLRFRRNVGRSFPTIFTAYSFEISQLSYWLRALLFCRSRRYEKLPFSIDVSNSKPPETAIIRNNRRLLGRVGHAQVCSTSKPLARGHATLFPSPMRTIRSFYPILLRLNDGKCRAMVVPQKDVC